MTQYIQIPKNLQTTLIQSPEQNPGTHIVSITLNNDTTIQNVTVVNTCVAIIKHPKQIQSHSIKSITLQEFPQ